jgi:V8-like Glu-specific endopeptidase
MSWPPKLTNLRDVLSALYLTSQSTARIVDDAGLNPAFIDLNGAPIDVWHRILKEANRRNKVQDIVDVALKDYPENDWLKLAKQGKLAQALKGPDIQKSVWGGTENPTELEKIIGEKSTLLPIGFLEVGIKMSQSVARVVLRDGSSGSGFLAKNNVLITNNHVIRSEAEAESAVVQFNYQLTPEGLFTAVEEHRLLPERIFATSKTDDWSAVQVKDNPVEKWGALELRRQNPKAGDHVNIVQHAGGGPKQIALYNNVVMFANENRLQYLTDTLPGSSGSPVFDDKWNIVGLHHSGGWLREPGSKKTYYRNEGIHINTVIEGLDAKGIRF